MSVLVEAISIIVRRDALERLYPGGVAAYEADCPNRTFCADDHLTRVGFMVPDDGRAFVEALEARGLTSFDGTRCVDIAVVYQRSGVMWPCDWIEHEVHPDGYELCWLAGDGPRRPGGPRGVDDQVVPRHAHHHRGRRCHADPPRHRAR